MKNGHCDGEIANDILQILEGYMESGSIPTAVFVMSIIYDIWIFTGKEPDSKLGKWLDDLASTQ